MKIKILQGRNSGKIIKKVNFGETHGFKPGTFELRDQCATTALFLSLSQAAKKLLFINGTYKLLHFCQKIREWSGCGMEQKSGISQLFNLSKIDHVGF